MDDAATLPPTAAVDHRMALTLSRRNLVLGVLLLATLAVSAWTLLQGTDDNAVVEPTTHAARPGASTAAAGARGAGAAAGPLVLAERPTAGAPGVNLFGSYSYQAPSAPAVAAPAQKPHAPPFPFPYTGRLDIDGRSTYLFLQGDAPLSLAIGSTAGEFTLVEAAGDRLVFLHGPTGERVTVVVSAPNN